ncbi:alpha/beta hydrolase [Octadecabacter sp. G9-8]|uniref:Alpha/beta hydrolase n=1 Tax=Octadecabacter dasysiphoniae TaxID=2909341 RepID=A0ABS9CUD6_9RHOB|nr:alpha/beta hydrolase [Octadecabacter dasysiphoniae]MCF2870382.1 alpha/beta hydrolase [Octadecabacter dasysiphoniae]
MGVDLQSLDSQFDAIDYLTSGQTIPNQNGFPAATYDFGLRPSPATETVGTALQFDSTGQDWTIAVQDSLAENPTEFLQELSPQGVQAFVALSGQPQPQTRALLGANRITFEIDQPTNSYQVLVDGTLTTSIDLQDASLNSLLAQAAPENHLSILGQRFATSPEDSDLTLAAFENWTGDPTQQALIDFFTPQVSENNFQFASDFLMSDLRGSPFEDVDFSAQDVIASWQNTALTSERALFEGQLYLKDDQLEQAIFSLNRSLALNGQNIDALLPLSMASHLAPTAAGALDTTTVAAELTRQIAIENPAAVEFVIQNHDTNPVPVSAEVTLIAAAQAPLLSDDPDIAQTARSVEINTCVEQATRGNNLCAFFDIGFITNRVRLPASPKVPLNYGINIGPLQIGLLRNPVNIAVNLDLETQTSGNAVKCAATFGFFNITCPRQDSRILADETDPKDWDATLLDPLTDLAAGLDEGYAHFTDFQPDQDPNTPRSAVIFIHGFNTDFASAVDSVSRLMLTARYPSDPYLLSWPSKGRTFVRMPEWGPKRKQAIVAYEADRDTVTASCAEMHRGIQAVIDRYGAGQVDLVVHSMGNQLLWEMVMGCGDAGLSWATDAGEKPFRTIVTAAADLSLTQFQDSAVTYTRLANNVVVYASPNDFVLDASESIFNRIWGDETDRARTRLGSYSKDHIFDLPIQVINTNLVDGTQPRSSRNHAYHIHSPVVRRDIAMILNGHVNDVAERCILTTPTANHYLISPSCL